MHYLLLCHGLNTLEISGEMMKGGSWPCVVCFSYGLTRLHVWELERGTKRELDGGRAVGIRGWLKPLSLRSPTSNAANGKHILDARDAHCTLMLRITKASSACFVTRTEGITQRCSRASLHWTTLVKHSKREANFNVCTENSRRPVYHFMHRLL